MKLTAALLLVGLYGSLVSGLSIDNGLVTLGDWTPSEYSQAKHWAMTEENTKIKALKNNPQPIWYYSPDNLIADLGGEFDCYIKVDTSADNDFVGLVLGVQPGDSTSTGPVDFLLLDWKQGNQGKGTKGLALSRVSVAVDDAKHAKNPYWTHGTYDDQGIVELARGNNFGNVGWSDKVDYFWRVTMTEHRVLLYVDGELEIDYWIDAGVEQDFTDGRLGFYAFSQKAVTFYKVAIDSQVVLAGESAVVAKNFSDTSGTVECEVDWADGTVEACSVSGNTATGTHDYAASGIYNVEMCLTDNHTPVNNDGLVCEHQTLSIDCPSGSTIKILDASYGRSEGGHICSHPSIRTTDCHASSSMDVVKGACEGQTSCTVRAKNHVFGDPCVGTFKYLTAEWECVSETVCDSVSLTVNTNSAPVALDKTRDVDQDSTGHIVLAATDFDGDSLVGTILSLPGSGSLWQTDDEINTSTEITSVPTDVTFHDGLTVIFVPAVGQSGDAYASFTFEVTDGLLTSNVATTTINVIPTPNNVPEATADTVTLDEDSEAVITLAGTDGDGHSLTATIWALPTGGSLFQYDGSSKGAEILATETDVTSADNKVVYVPDANQHGTDYDAFRFKVHDGEVFSQLAAEVTVHVTSVDDDPVATNVHVTDGVEDLDVVVTLDVTDPDSASPSALISSLPSLGTLYQYNSGSRGAQISSVPTAVTDSSHRVIFLGASNGYGLSYDSFGFKSTASGKESTAATATVDLIHVNDAPHLGYTGPASPTFTICGPSGNNLGGFMISDDTLAGDYSVSVAVTYGTVSVDSNPGFLSIDLGENDGTDSALRFSGNETTLETALESLTYYCDPQIPVYDDNVVLVISEPSDEAILTDNAALVFSIDAEADESQTVVGAGPDGDLAPGEVFTLTLNTAYSDGTPKTGGGDEVEIYIDSTPEDDVVSDNDDGSYSYDFSSTIAGDHSVIWEVNDVIVAEFVVTVTPGAPASDSLTWSDNFEDEEGGSVDPTDLDMFQVYTMTFTLTDDYGNDITLEPEELEVSSDAEGYVTVTDGASDGEYVVEFSFEDTCEACTLSVGYDGSDFYGFPLDIVVYSEGLELISAVASDPMDEDSHWDAGDRLLLEFSDDTNQLEISTKEQIDAVFEFSWSLGANYEGSWIDESHLLIEVLDGSGSEDPEIGVSTVSMVDDNELQAAHGPSRPTTGEAVLSGEFGELASGSSNAECSGVSCYVGEGVVLVVLAVASVLGAAVFRSKEESQVSEDPVEDISAEMAAHAKMKQLAGLPGLQSGISRSLKQIPTVVKNASPTSLQGLATAGSPRTPVGLDGPSMPSFNSVAFGGAPSGPSGVAIPNLSAAFAARSSPRSPVSMTASNPLMAAAQGMQMGRVSRPSRAAAAGIPSLGRRAPAPGPSSSGMLASVPLPAPSAPVSNMGSSLQTTGPGATKQAKGIPTLGRRRN